MAIYTLGPCLLPPASHLSTFSLSLLDPVMLYVLVTHCVQLCNPMDCSLPGSSVHGILQARILGCHALLQRIFLTQESNLGLPHCRLVYVIPLKVLCSNLSLSLQSYSASFPLAFNTVTHTLISAQTSLTWGLFLSLPDEIRSCHILALYHRILFLLFLWNLFIFLMKVNCFTELCWFLPNINMNQP